MIAIPEGQELQVIEKKTADVVTAANLMVVDNQDRYDRCADFLRGIKELQRQVDETFDQNIADAHSLHKNLVAAKKKHSEPLVEAERIIKAKSLDYITEQERLEAEARRKAAEEAQRAEIKRKAELEAQAKAHEEKGNLGLAEARRAAAEAVYVPIKNVEPVFNRAAGQSVKVTWRCEVVDPVALCRLIADGVLPAIMVTPNQAKLDGLARTMTNTKQYPGLKFVEEKVLAVRR